MMTRIAVLGGTGYLASLIKNQNNFKKNNYTFFSRKKNSKNYIDYLNFENSINLLKKYNFIIHLAGPSKKEIQNKKNLIDKKIILTKKICDICIKYNIKLIYISSMQVYRDYGQNDIIKNSKIDRKNFYAKSHYDSEKIIFKKFLNYKNMFIILRLGNVFGFKKYLNLNELNKNIIHQFCKFALQKKNILLKKGNIQRAIIPSNIFIRIINKTIERKKFKNSITNICYKVYNLKEIATIIKQRAKLILNLDIKIKVNKYKSEKKNKVYVNKHFKIKFVKTKIFDEIDHILKIIL